MWNINPSELFPIRLSSTNKEALVGTYHALLRLYVDLSSDATNPIKLPVSVNEVSTVEPTKGWKQVSRSGRDIGPAPDFVNR
jgi:hypothetical protein